MVMIETAEALDNLDAIESTPGVDGLFVAPVGWFRGAAESFAQMKAWRADTA